MKCSLSVCPSYLDPKIRGEMKRISFSLSCVDSNMRGEIKFVRLSYLDPKVRGKQKRSLSVCFTCIPTRRVK